MRDRRTGRLPWMTAVVACLFALNGCGKPAVVEPPPPPIVDLEIQASSSINPDSAGRPSPVVLRVYELSDESAFLAADLPSLWSRETEVLAGTLVSRHEYVIAPGGKQADKFKLAAPGNRIGVAAGFRDFRNATWRMVRPTAGEPVPQGYVLLVSIESKSVSGILQPAGQAGAVN